MLSRVSDYEFSIELLKNKFYKFHPMIFMKEWKLLLISATIFGVFSCVDSVVVSDSSLSPIQKQVGKLVISIDPRLELLNSIQGISNYDILHRQRNSYHKQIKEYFEPYVSSQAVALTNKFAATGFTYDAPVSFMLHLTQPNGCLQNIPYGDYLKGRSGGTHKLIQYQQAIHDFAIDSRFERFWKKNEPFYKEIVDLSVTEVSKRNWIDALENYYNASQNSYTIIISPLLSNGYGFRIPAKNNNWDSYACLPTDGKTRNGIPYLDETNLMFYVWHEFGHSYVNPEIEKYAERLENSSILFEPLQILMKKQAYDSWKICVMEHIVRAIHIRLIETYIGKSEASLKLDSDQKNGFAYIKPLLEKLKMYENMRNIDKISFSDFVPKLLDVFDSIAKIDYMHYSILSGSSFSGPINNVFNADKIVVIYPTNDQDKESLFGLRKYAEKIQQYLKRKSICISDTAAIVKDLSSCGLVVYGSVESNLFLKKYKNQFPFKIEANTLITNRKYTKAGIKFISCLPNPQNKNLGMVIYTAVINKDIEDINNVFHGPEDYVLFIDREHILSRGFYKKSENWTF